jgi:IS30 family transposase
MMDFLAAEFKLDGELSALFKTVSGPAVDRKLRKEKARYRLKGMRTTKPGTLLKNQIPVRVCFGRDERRPGFFELDTVSHCGARAEFCQTLTATGAGSGWTEEYALPSRAHRWVKAQIALMKSQLPFPLLGIDSGNGGEFINHQLLDWRRNNGVKFTRGRPYRKNDNCFVEQKNGDVVRKTVGYARFEGENALPQAPGISRSQR